MIALALRLGADFVGVHLVHAAWAGLLAAVCYLVSRRFVGRAAAGFAALALVVSPVWALHASMLLTECTAAGVLALSILLARRAFSGVLPALGFALFAVLAWATRPNLSVVVPAAVLAFLFTVGPRKALRSVPLWVLVATFVLVRAVVVAVATEYQGIAPYSHYGVMFVVLDTPEVSNFVLRETDPVAFVAANLDQILLRVRSNMLALTRALFLERGYLFVGWIAVPVLVHAFLRRGRSVARADGEGVVVERAFVRRYAAFLALGVVTSGVIAWSGFAPLRYPVPAMVPLLFLLADASEELFAWVRRSTGRSLGAIPVTLLALGVLADGEVARGVGRAIDVVGDLAAGRRPPSPLPQVQQARAAATLFEPSALVASTDPWVLYLYGGNTGLLVPRDLTSNDLVDAYLDRYRPEYVVVDDHEDYAVLAASPRLELVVQAGRYAILRFSEVTPDERRWSAAPLVPGIE
ncbi:MAG: hypothetical protein R3F34_10740 [Planctomycetota bacterium]